MTAENENLSGYVQVDAEVDEEGRQMLKKLSAFFERLKDEKGVLIISVPEATQSDGTLFYPIGIGTTKLDFYEGEIIDTLGQKYQMHAGLKFFKEDFMHSFRIFSDQEIKVDTDGFHVATLMGGEAVGFSNTPFKVLYIRSNVAANIRLFASTSPQAITANMIAPPILRSELYQVDGSKAQRVSLDCGLLGRWNVELYANATIPTPFTLESSADGVHWFQAFSYGATTALHQGYQNAMRYIRLTSVPAGGVLDLLLVASQ